MSEKSCPFTKAVTYLAAAGVLAAAVYKFCPSGLFKRSCPSTKAAPTGTKQKVGIVFVLGGPGSGKGTVCERLVSDLGLHHISAGDELRAARDRGDETAALIESYILEGKIVPVEITCQLLKDKMNRTESNAQDIASGMKIFLIDGFPRNADNVEGWEKSMAPYYSGEDADLEMVNIAVLHMDASEDIMRDRCLDRANTQGRSDDNVESILKRYRTYVESTKPVLDLFEKKQLVEEINAEFDKDNVYQQVITKLSARSEVVAQRLAQN